MSSYLTLIQFSLIIIILSSLIIQIVLTKEIDEVVEVKVNNSDRDSGDVNEQYLLIVNGKWSPIIYYYY